MARRAIFWGAKGQAKVCRDALRDDAVDLLALFDSNAAEITSPFRDVPLFPAATLDDWLAQQQERDSIGFLVTIGGDRGALRVAIHEELCAKGLAPLSARHPSSIVAPDAVVGAGAQICASAIVCVDVRLGRQCIINTKASVDHESVLGDGVHIAPGATLAGCVTVGDFATIYSGAVVAPRISVGARAVVGAGSVVIRDVPEGVLVAGNPAKVIRSLS